jgi:nucleoside-diphosphate-sugar epimerase
MHALVTGAAGFVGSHLCERLVADGHDVRAVDCLTPYYSLDQKRSNLSSIESLDRCEIVEADLRTSELAPILEGIDVILHQAGQPGVRASWADGFASYVEHNLLATQRMLEAVRDRRLDRFVFASSSSVYGDAPSYPTSERDLPRPQSPYGVTKLAAEHLCGVYARQWGVPTISLRYFTVYGPRQRPDMAMYRLIEAALTRTPFPLFGDGRQIRDFTFVEDVVEANVAAAIRDVEPGEVLNIAGGSQAMLSDVIEVVGDLVGRPVPLERQRPERGDVARTGAAVDRARAVLGWAPRVSLRDGLAKQVAWHARRRVDAPVT